MSALTASVIAELIFDADQVLSVPLEESSIWAQACLLLRRQGTQIAIVSDESFDVRPDLGRKSADLRAESRRHA